MTAEVESWTVGGCIDTIFKLDTAKKVSFAFFYKYLIQPFFYDKKTIEIQFQSDQIL